MVLNGMGAIICELFLNSKYCSTNDLWLAKSLDVELKIRKTDYRLYMEGQCP